MNIQLKLWSSEAVQNIMIIRTSLTNQDGNEIAKDNLNIYPVRYVLTDQFLTGCGWRDHDTIPAFIVADLPEYNQRFNLEGSTLRPVWLIIDIPQGSAPGVYHGSARNILEVFQRRRVIIKGGNN